MSEALEEVLRGHAWLTPTTRRPAYGCLCGWDAGNGDLNIARRRWATHVAAEVRAWLARLAGDAEVREVAYDALRSEWSYDRHGGPDAAGRAMASAANRALLSAAGALP